MLKTPIDKKTIVINIRKKASERAGLHVISHDNGWVVKKEGSAKSSAKFGSKQDAITEAARKKNTSRNAQQIVIHNRDGRIESFFKENNRQFESVVVSTHDRNNKVKVKC